jgi:predicted NAD-dependent protein-ADP-ribosyltransferase YbiA (DUF1768 family)
MAIKTELTQWEFTNEFMKVRPDNFSLRGLEALYQYFYEVSEEMGEDIEFDPIAICCEFTEYDNFEEVQQYYDVNTFDELDEQTRVIEVHDSEILIVQQF